MFVSVMALSAPARADGPGDVVVTLVPGQPSLFSGTIPAGRAFTVQVPTAGNEGNLLKGVLEVWPRATQNDCKQTFASTDERQHYRLGMNLDATAQMLRAAVPPLQVAQPFCFRIERRMVVSQSIAESLSADVYPLLSIYLQKRLLPAEKDLVSYVGRLIEKSLLRRNLQPEAAKLETVASRLWSSLRPVTYELRDARDNLSAAQVELEGREMKVNQAKAAISSLALPAPLKFYTFIIANGSGRTIVTLEDIRSAPPTPEQLGDIATQLLQYNKETLSRKFRNIQAEADEKKRSELLKAISDDELGAPPSSGLAVQLWVPDTKGGSPYFQPLSALQKDGPKHSPKLFDILDSVRPQLEAYKDFFAKRVQPPASTDLDAWVRALDEFSAALDQRDAARTQLDAVQTTLETVKGKFESQLRSLFTREENRQNLEVLLQPIDLPALAGSLTTPDKNNYVSIDAGVALAVPIAGGVHTPWLLPYAGVNFYFTPVDRTMSLSQLVGSRFWQIFSLTVGLTLTSPSGPPGRISGPFWGGYPVLAVGFRMSNYIRIVGGTVLYRLADVNPASADSSIVGAPFLGLSFDADIISFVTSDSYFKYAVKAGGG